MNNLKTSYIIRQVQLEGWNIQVGVCTPDGSLLYTGKSESLLSLRWEINSQISIYDNAGLLLVNGEARPNGKWFSIPKYVLMRDGQDECIILPNSRIIQNIDATFDFADGDSCLFSCSPFSSTYKGESKSGWRYEAEVGAEWNITIWGLEDDLILLSALMYSFRQSYFNQFS